MATYQRIGYALYSTLALLVGGVLYNRVYVTELVPLVNQNGIFSEPVFILERLAPIVLLVLLAAVWLWVVAGAVQDEKTVDRRRVR
jgi:hypothetical protein